MGRLRATAKRSAPAFQLYAGDWLGSTLAMAWEIKGIYIDLLCWSWENGPLPNDPRWRQRMIGGTAHAVARRWAALKSRWKLTPRGWVNPRLERQRQLQAAFRTRAKKAAAARWEHLESDRIRVHPPSIAQASPQASRKHMLGACSSSSSSEDLKDRRAPAADPPGDAVAFRVYCAIAGCALDAAPATADLGELAARFKTICAKSQITCDVDTPRKALDAVIRARGNRRM
jgi:uncharacterized protein YdaU (DUF1376 family)